MQFKRKPVQYRRCVSACPTLSYYVAATLYYVLLTACRAWLPLIPFVPSPIPFFFFVLSAQLRFVYAKLSPGTNSNRTEQLVRQYPSSFEFTGHYLERLVEGVYSAGFLNFAGERKRGFRVGCEPVCGVSAEATP